MGNDPQPTEPAIVDPSGDQTDNPDLSNSDLSNSDPSNSRAAASTPVRLQRVLANAGFGSRRICDDIIAAGRVTVNSKVAILGQRVDPETDAIAVDEVAVAVRPGLVYYLLNKPAGVVTTASDTHSRPTVLDNLPPEPRVFPVGRLDMETEGVLILTNDGDLAHRLTHPSYGVSKSYTANLASSPSPGDLRLLREGIQLEDGMTAPAKVSLPSPDVLRITIHEGRNRIVRRMCEHIGCKVRRLVRHRFGPLTAGKLAPGEWRDLTIQEVRSLERAAAESAPRKPQSSDKSN